MRMRPRHQKMDRELEWARKARRHGSAREAELLATEGSGNSPTFGDISLPEETDSEDRVVSSVVDSCDEDEWERLPSVEESGFNSATSTDAQVRCCDWRARSSEAEHVFFTSCRRGVPISGHFDSAGVFGCSDSDASCRSSNSSGTWSNSGCSPLAGVARVELLCRALRGLEPAGRCRLQCVLGHFSCGVLNVCSGCYSASGCSYFNVCSGCFDASGCGAFDFCSGCCDWWIRNSADQSIGELGAGCLALTRLEAHC